MMNYIFYAFLLLSGISIILSIKNLIRKIVAIKPLIRFEELSHHLKAVYLMKKVRNGDILKHVLKNDSPPRDDSRQIIEYKAFLLQKTTQNIKYLKGDLFHDTFN